MRLNSVYKICFLLIVVLGCYFPAISGCINSIDDVHILDVFGENGHLTLKDLLMPGRGYYYRPLIELSYYLDYHLWGLDASFMHLENIFLHAANTILVFLIAAIIYTTPDMQRRELPLLAALLFALHPLNTEAVSWIAGRTDPLATLFVLLAVFSLLKSFEERKTYFLYLATLFLLVGALAKEVAIFFLPAAFFLVIYRQHELGESIEHNRTRKLLIPLLVVSALIVSAFVARLLGGGSNSITALIKTKHIVFNDMLMVSLQTLGFYVKKIFLPLPLNFAIASVNSHYSWLGTVVLFGGLITLFRKLGTASVFTLIGLFLILPAIIVAVTNIAWTPVAERYMYLPLTFFSIGFVGLGYQLLSRLGKSSLSMPVAVIVLFPMAFITVERNTVWQDNLTLYKDTVGKSPELGRLRNELAIALIKKGHIAEGTEQLEVGRKLNSNMQIDRLFMLNQTALMLRGKTPEEARVILLKYIIDKKNADFELLKMLNKFDEKRLYSTVDKNEKIAIAKEIIETNNFIYSKTNESFCLYRNGQLSLDINDKLSAACYFRKAYATAPENMYFKDAARKLAEKLSQ